MLIDWFTVGAQFVNFIVLVVLLKRFLYRPILDALATREQRIGAQAAAADAKMHDADQALQKYELKDREFEANRVALLAKAQAAAGEERTRLVGLAQQEALALRSQQIAALAASKVQSDVDLRQLAVTEVYAVARSALRDLGSVELEECIVATFVRRLGEMSPQTRDLFRSAVTNSANSATVRTRCELPEKQRETLQNALNQTLAGTVRLEFATSPTSLAGLEVSARGQRIAWSVEDFLDALQKSAEHVLTSGLTSGVPVASAA